MMCRLRSWSNRRDVNEHDNFMSWDVHVGNHPLMDEIALENPSTSGAGR